MELVKINHLQKLMGLLYTDVFHRYSVFSKIIRHLLEPLPFLLINNSLKQRQNELQHDKTNKMTCAPSEDSDQPDWSESLVSLWRNLGFLPTHWAHIKDSDQSGWMPKLIWVFAVCIGHFVFCHAPAQIAFWWDWQYLFLINFSHGEK